MSCQLRFPDCEEIAEVIFSAGSVVDAAACLSCGKEYQQRFSHTMDTMRIVPFNCPNVGEKDE